MADPGTLGATMWLDALVGVSLSGADVTLWADQSGNGNDIGQAIGGQQPELVADLFGTGLDGIQFDGTTEWLGPGPASTVVIDGSSSVVAGVFRARSADTGTGNFYENSPLITGALGYWAIYARGGGFIGYGGYDGGVNDVDVAASIGATAADIHIFVALHEAGTLTLDVDGVTGTVACGAIGFTALDFLRIGRQYVAGGTVYGAVDVAELALFDTALTSGDRTDLAAYLRNKWIPPIPSPTYEVVVDPNAAHVQDPPTADLQWMPDSHGADAPGIGYPPADQYRSDV